MCHPQSKVSQPGYKAGFNSECLFVALLCVSLALYSLSWNFIFQSRSLKFKWKCVFVWIEYKMQGDYDGRGQQTASPMLTAIMSGGVGISGRELSTQLINALEQANHSFS